MLILLALHLSKPLLNIGRTVTVHWIQPRKEVVENFRFELEEAAKRGEQRFWFTGEPVRELHLLPSMQETDFQQVLNRSEGWDRAEIYLANRDDFTRFSRVYVPGSYRLHLVEADTTVEEAYVLPEGTITVLVESEKETITAALHAIQEVYPVRFQIAELRVPDKRYDVSFTHRPDSLAAINVVSDARKLPVNLMAGYPRTLWFPAPLNPESSPFVFDGKLPESILEMLVTGKMRQKVSEKQLRDKFAERPSDNEAGGLLLFLLFLAVLFVERYISVSRSL